MLFGGSHIPWKKAAPVKAAAEDAPSGEQGTPDSWRSGRWKGRSTTTQGLAPGATPALVAAALEQAEQGAPAKMFSLIQEMTDRSPDFVAGLGTRKRAVAQTAWHLEPAGPRATDRRIAENVERWIREIPKLETAFVNLLAGIENGFAAVEIEWEVVTEGSKPVAKVKRLQYRPSAWFKPSPDDPESWNILDTDNLIDGKPLLPNKWVTHLHQAKPGFPAQAGLGRILLWFWLFSHYALKDWSAYAEMYGSPLRLGKAATGATSSQMDAVEDALEQLGVDAYAVLPPGWEVEFVGDSGNKSGAEVYQTLIEYLGKAFAKIILGQTLTTEQGGSGSYALGTVHNGVRMDLARSDAGQLASSLTDGLVAAIVRFNYGEDVAVPRFVFDMEPPRDAEKDARAQKGRGEVFKIALELGLPVSRSQIAEELQLREPTGADDLLMKASTPADPDDDADPDESGDDDSEEDDDAGDE